MGGEKVQHAVPVPQPPAPVRGLQRKPAPLEQFKRGRIGGVLAGGQRDREKLLRSIHLQGRGDRCVARRGTERRRGTGGGRRYRQGGGGRERGCGRFRFQQFTHPAQEMSHPQQRPLRFVDPEESRLTLEMADQFTELASIQLKHQERCRTRPESLQRGQRRKPVRFRGSRQIEFHLDRDGVASGSRGKIGWEQKPEHGGSNTHGATAGGRRSSGFTALRVATSPFRPLRQGA